MPTATQVSINGTQERRRTATSGICSVGTSASTITHHPQPASGAVIAPRIVDVLPPFQAGAAFQTVKQPKYGSVPTTAVPPTTAVNKVAPDGTVVSSQSTIPESEQSSSEEDEEERYGLEFKKQKFDFTF